MSINAINSVSVYEYYYNIEKDDKKKKSSAIDKQMKELGLTPTDNEALNISLIKKAKSLQKEEESPVEKNPGDRPWKDLMYQLNLNFNENPLDDISDIKKELKELIAGIEDEELQKEVVDLENYVQNLYISYSNNSVNSLGAFNNELNNLALLNKVNFL